MQFLDEKVWFAIEVGWKKLEEPHATWDDSKIKAANFNSRALKEVKRKKKLIQVLLTDVSDQDNLAIYAVWDMGGLGKTTLAQLIYNDIRVQRHYDMRIWVCIR